MNKPLKKPLSHSTLVEELIEVTARSGNVKLNLFVENEDWVAIEGDRTSLEFLGKLLLMFAKEDGPPFLILDSPGSIF